MNSPVSKVVIIGSGLAGVSTANGLRKAGYTGSITIVSEENHAPYDRPPLSKQFLLDGNADHIRIGVDVLPQVDLVTGDAATSIDVTANEVLLASGKRVAWDRLVIATGALPKRLPFLDAGPVPTHVLRTLDDSIRIREHLVPGATLLVVGAGPIGLELAVSAAKLGTSVTVVEAATRVMGRCTSLVLSETLFKHHLKKGIDVRLGASVKGVDGDGRVTLSDGHTVRPDLIVVGIGVVANDGLALQAGLAARDGIFVDELGRTTAPGVYAVGDVTRQRNPVNGEFERIETWANAKDQALSVARGIADAAAALPYTAVPWFWSEQGELRLQSAGVPVGDEEIIRGDPASERFVTLQLKQGRLVGVAALNAVKEFGMFKKLIAAHAVVDKAQIADPTVDLKALVAQAEAAFKAEQEART